MSGQKNRYFQLTRSLKRVGKSVGRGNRCSIAQAVCDDKSIRQHVIQAISRVIKQEISVLCSRKLNSTLRLKSKQQLEAFTWDHLWSETQSHAPTLASVLTSTVSITDDSIYPPLCVVAGILMKTHNPQINLVQSIVSLVLKMGQATKQACYSLVLFLCTCLCTLSNVRMSVLLCCRLSPDFRSLVYVWPTIQLSVF